MVEIFVHGTFIVLSSFESQETMPKNVMLFNNKVFFVLLT